MNPVSTIPPIQPKQRLSKSTSITQVDDKMKAVELGTDTKAKCNFCGRGPTSDDLKSGKFYQLHTFKLHYFCLLFAYNGQQKGEDEEGLNGFLVSDVKTQINKSKKHKCIYCDKTGAMSKCQKKGCGKWLHFPCGLAAGATFQFLGSMDVFCGKHRMRQNAKLLAAIPPDYDCVVCYEEVEKEGEMWKIVVPCCHRHFHRSCVQKMGMISGKHHFKCPNCNNKDVFVDEIERLGVYIPVADAAWESEDNSDFYNYEDMYVQEKVCEAEVCLCKEEEGRNYHEDDGDFEVVLCKFCGTAGCHVLCGNLDKAEPEYECTDCEREETPENLEFDDVEKDELSILLKENDVVNSAINEIAPNFDDDNDELEMLLKENEELGDNVFNETNYSANETIDILSDTIDISSDTSFTEDENNISSDNSFTEEENEEKLIDRVNELLAQYDDSIVETDNDNEIQNVSSDISIVQHFDDETDELECLLKEVEDSVDTSEKESTSLKDNIDEVTESDIGELVEYKPGPKSRKHKLIVKESSSATSCSKDTTSGDKIISMKEQIVALLNDNETTSQFVSSNPEDDKIKQDKDNNNVEQQIKYKPGPKSRINKFITIESSGTEPGDMIEKSASETHPINIGEKDKIAIEQKYKPGPKSKKATLLISDDKKTSKSLNEVEVSDKTVKHQLNREISHLKRGANYLKPCPKSRKLKTQNNELLIKPVLKLLDLNKLKQSPEVKETSKSSWYLMATSWRPEITKYRTETTFNRFAEKSQQSLSFIQIKNGPAVAKPQRKKSLTSKVSSPMSTIRTTSSPPSSNQISPPQPTKESSSLEAINETSVQSNPVDVVLEPTRKTKKPFSCPICSGSFKSLLILKTHLTNLHFLSRLQQRIQLNGSSFSCPVEDCLFKNDKKEDIIEHITEEHDLAFEIAKELFPNFTTEPQNKEPSEELTTSCDVPQMAATLKRRSTESNEFDAKKQKLVSKATRKVDLPTKPKTNVQMAAVRPTARKNVTNEDDDLPVKMQENNISKNVASNTVIMPTDNMPQWLANNWTF